MTFMTQQSGIASIPSVGLGFVLLCFAPVAPSLAQSSEMIQRALLEGIARNQYSVLCQSEAFTQCMGFSGSACTDLSEAAIKQCLLPLPNEISPDKLDNDALESCPKQVFADAGFTEEKAGLCFDKAMEADAK